MFLFQNIRYFILYRMTR